MAHDDERLQVTVSLVRWLGDRRVPKTEVRATSDPLPLAGALIADAHGRLLLIHRSMAEMCWWEVPGGKVEAGEDPWQAAQRELAEELNVVIEFVAEVGTERFVQGDQPLQYTWYVARLIQGQPKVVEIDRFDGWQYFAWEELDALTDASPSVKCLRERFASAVLEALPLVLRPDREQTRI